MKNGVTPSSSDTTSGIGQATAVSFAQEGCPKIAIADLNECGLRETESLLRNVSSGCSFISVLTDVSSAQSVQVLIDSVVREFGRIDYVCNAAGFAPFPLPLPLPRLALGLTMDVLRQVF